MENQQTSDVPKEIKGSSEVTYKNYEGELNRLTNMIEGLIDKNGKTDNVDIAWLVAYPVDGKYEAPVDWVLDIPGDMDKYDFYTDRISEFFYLCTDFESHKEIHSSESDKTQDKHKSIEWQRKVAKKVDEITEVIDGRIQIKPGMEDEFGAMSAMFNFFEKTNDYLQNTSSFAWSSKNGVRSFLSGIQNDITTTLLLKSTGLEMLDSSLEDDSKHDIDFLYKSGDEIIALDVTGKSPEKIGKNDKNYGFMYYPERKKGWGSKLAKNMQEDKKLKDERKWKTISYLAFGPKTYSSMKFYDNDRNKAVIGWPSQRMIKDFNSVIER